MIGKRFFIGCVLLCFTMVSIYAQQLSVSLEKDAESIKEQVQEIDLPIVYIYTNNSLEPPSANIAPPENCMGSGTTGNDYVKGRIVMYDNDELLYDSGEYKKGASGMQIRVRGNSSALIQNKSFKVKLQIAEDLLHREASEYKNRHWALLNYFSTCDLRTVVGLYAGKLVGMEWEPEWRFVNLFVNDTYRGLYLLAETVGVSEGRCHVGSTGFMFEADPYWWNEDKEDGVVQTDHLPYAMGYTFKYPKYKAADPVLDEIKNYMNCFEDSLYGYKDISKFIDYESFAKWMVVHDILGTQDGAGSNLFVLKDDFLAGEARYSTPLRMGPVWDLGTIFSTPDNWATAHYMSFFYYHMLFQNKQFVEEYVSQYKRIREDIGPKIISFIKEIIEEEGEALNESRMISPLDKGYHYRLVDDDLKEAEAWFETRIHWMDAAIEKLLIETEVNKVKQDTEIVSVCIFDLNGQIRGSLKSKKASDLYHGNLSDYQQMFSLESGVYILRALYSNGSIRTRKSIL